MGLAGEGKGGHGEGKGRAVTDTCLGSGRDGRAVIGSNE